eukprot:4729378-Pleurochrysis_carterae.AAC.1
MCVILPSTTLCGTLRRWVGGSLMRKKRAEIRKRAGTWLRETCVVVVASAIARSTARVKPSSWKYFLPGS